MSESSNFKPGDIVRVVGAFKKTIIKTGDYETYLLMHEALHKRGTLLEVVDQDKHPGVVPESSKHFIMVSIPDENINIIIHPEYLEKVFIL